MSARNSVKAKPRNAEADRSIVTAAFTRVRAERDDMVATREALGPSFSRMSLRDAVLGLIKDRDVYCEQAVAADRQCNEVSARMSAKIVETERLLREKQFECDVFRERERNRSDPNLDAEKNALRAEIRRQVDEIAALTADNATLLAERDRLLASIDQHLARIAALSREIEQAHAHASTLRARLAMAQRQADRATEAVTGLAFRLGDAENYRRGREDADAHASGLGATS